MKTFMTLDEWVKTYAEGMRGALEQSFHSNGRLHHIEDLMAWTATYTDNVYQFVCAMPPSGFSYAEEMEKAKEEKERKSKQRAALDELRELGEDENWDAYLKREENEKDEWRKAIKEGRVNPHAFHIQWNEPDPECGACGLKAEK